MDIFQNIEFPINTSSGQFSNANLALICFLQRKKGTALNCFYAQQVRPQNNTNLFVFLYIGESVHKGQNRSHLELCLCSTDRDLFLSTKIIHLWFCLHPTLRFSLSLFCEKMAQYQITCLLLQRAEGWLELAWHRTIRQML